MYRTRELSDAERGRLDTMQRLLWQRVATTPNRDVTDLVTLDAHLERSTLSLKNKSLGLSLGITLGAVLASSLGMKWIHADNGEHAEFALTVDGPRRFLVFPIAMVEKKIVDGRLALPLQTLFEHAAREHGVFVQSLDLVRPRPDSGPVSTLSLIEAFEEIQAALEELGPDVLQAFVVNGRGELIAASGAQIGDDWTVEGFKAASDQIDAELTGRASVFVSLAAERVILTVVETAGTGAMREALMRTKAAIGRAVLASLGDPEAVAAFPVISDEDIDELFSDRE